VNPPAAPTGVTAGALSQSAIRVSWQPAAGATSYQVGVAPAAAGPWEAAGPETTATSFTQTGLQPGTTRYYIVQSLNSGGVTDSATVSATTLGFMAPATPVPTSVITPATGLTPWGVLVMWPPVAGADRYQVAYADSPAGPPWEFTGPTPSALQWYPEEMIMAPRSGQRRTFVVRAMNAYGASGASSVV